MWALIKDNKIEEIFKFPKNLVIDNINHPRAIFSTLIWEQLDNIGIYTVEAGTKGDDKFEVTSNPVYTFNKSKKKVTTKYTITDKENLEDANAKDKDGNDLKDEKGNQIINYGLKTIWINKIKETAYSKLSKTDWYVIRKTEGVDIPESITEARTAIRTDCKTIEDKIIACKTMTAFKKLFIAPTDDDGNTTGNAPIDDWTV